jgi:hypothetical protein
VWIIPRVNVDHVHFPLAERAPKYISRGWSLLPIRREAKAPHTELLTTLYGTPQRGHLALGPANLGEVELWFEEEPEINLGVFPGGPAHLLLVDIDRLDLLDPDLQTPTATSGREGGGKHLYLSHPEPVPMSPQRWGHVNPAYLVLPGSIHESGRKYEWLPALSPEDVPLMPFAKAAPTLGLEKLVQ